MRNKARFSCILLLLLLLLIVTTLSHSFALEIDSVGDILAQIDLSELEKFYNSLSDGDKVLLGNSIKEFLTDIVNGNTFKIEGVLPYVVNIISGEAMSILPSFLVVLSVLLLSSLLCGLNPGFASKSINSVISFSSVCIIGAILCFQVIQSIDRCLVFVKTVYNLTQITFPIIFAILTTMGASLTVGILQGSIAVFLTIISVILTSLILPIALSSTLLTIVTNLSSSLNLNKIPTFMNSFAKKTINISFLGFSSLLALQGISAQAYDSVGVRIAKFSLSKYVPILGGYLSSGFDYLYAGSVIVKNTFGVSFLVLIAISVIPTVLRLIFINLCIELLSVASSSLGNNCVSKMLDGTKNSVALIISSVLGLTLSTSVLGVMIILSFNSL